jgi:hypothetical protein
VLGRGDHVLSPRPEPARRDRPHVLSPRPEPARRDRPGQEGEHHYLHLQLALLKQCHYDHDHGHGHGRNLYCRPGQMRAPVEGHVLLVPSLAQVGDWLLAPGTSLHPP